jgi:hypothetical protein
MGLMINLALKRPIGFGSRLSLIFKVRLFGEENVKIARTASPDSYLKNLLAVTARNSSTKSVHGSEMIEGARKARLEALVTDQFPCFVAFICHQGLRTDDAFQRKKSHRGLFFRSGGFPTQESVCSSMEADQFV